MRFRSSSIFRRFAIDRISRNTNFLHMWTEKRFWFSWKREGQWRDAKAIMMTAYNSTMCTNYDDSFYGNAYGHAKRTNPFYTCAIVQMEWGEQKQNPEEMNTLSNHCKLWSIAWVATNSNLLSVCETFSFSYLPSIEWKKREYFNKFKQYLPLKRLRSNRLDKSLACGIPRTLKIDRKKND